MDRFTVRRRAVLRDPSMLAQGLAGNITGARADLIVCDDVEVAGNCDTPAKRAELRERLAETEFVLTPGGTILYVGTPHCAETLYLPPGHADAWLVGYRRLVVPLLDAAGESAWPERFAADDVAALRARVGPLRFARQMLLQPVAEAAARLDPALVVRYAEEPEYREAGGPGAALAPRPPPGVGWRLLGSRPMAGRARATLPCSPPPTRTARATTSCTAWPISRTTRTVRSIPRPSNAAPSRRWRGSCCCRRCASRPTASAASCPRCCRREMARAGAPCAVVEHTSRQAKALRILGGAGAGAGGTAPPRA